MSIIMISCSYSVLSSIAPVTCTSLVIYLLICSCSRLGFQCMIMIRFYGYTCAYPGSPLGFASLLAWGVLTPLDSHVQVLELGASQYSEPVEPLLLIRGTAVAWTSSWPFRALSFQTPCEPLEFSLVNSWVPFVLFILLYILVLSQLRHSGDVIFM